MPRMCEVCSLKQANFGTEGEGKKRWCAKCGKARGAICLQHSAKQKQKQAKAQAVPKVMRDEDVPSRNKLARLCREAEKEAEAAGARVLALRTATDGTTLPPMEQAVTQRYEVLRDRLHGYVYSLIRDMPTLKRELEGRQLLTLVYKYGCALADIGGEAASGGARVVRGVLNTRNGVAVACAMK